MNGAALPANALLAEAGLEVLATRQALPMRTRGFAADFAKLMDTLSALDPPLAVGVEILRVDAAIRHAKAMADRELARRQYGQALTPLMPDARGRPGGGLVRRQRALDEMDAAFAIRPGGDVQPATIVLGEEGVGKSWLAADWWRLAQPKRILLFIPSASVASVAKEPEELIARSCFGLLAPERIARPEPNQWWKRWLASDDFRTRAHAQLLIIIDGINERPSLDWAQILTRVWSETKRLGAGLVVTCRPSFWTREVANRVDWDEPEIVRLHGFDNAELAQALAMHGRDAESLSQRMRSRLSNPRAFTLAMRLLDKLPPDTDLGIDRLLFHYWEDRRRDRPDLPRDDAAFLQGLAAQAEVFQARRIEAVRDGGRDVDPADLPFPGDEMGDQMLFFKRYGAPDRAEVDAFVGEMVDGTFFEGVAEGPLVMGRQYVFRRASLAFALGIHLIAELLAFYQKKRLATKRNADLLVSEDLAVRLEPVMDFDQTAGQMLAAATIACLDPGVPSVVRKAVILAFIGLRNRPEALRPELEALAVDAPQAFADALDHTLATDGAEGVDPWLVDGLRFAYRVRPERETLRAILRRWMIPPARGSGPSAAGARDRISDDEWAVLSLSLAARIVAGLDLVELAPLFLDWVLAETENHRGKDGAISVSLPIVQLVRRDDCNPRGFEAAALAEINRRAPSLTEDHRAAAATLCEIIATPEALELAISLVPGWVATLDAPAPSIDNWWPLSSPSRTPAVLAAAGKWPMAGAPPGVVDALIVGRAQLLGAAHAAPANLPRLTRQLAGKAVEIVAVASLSRVSPSFMRLLPVRTSDALWKRAVRDFERRASDRDALRALDIALESRLATQPAQKQLETLSALPWRLISADGWPIRQDRWRPKLAADDLDALLDNHTTGLSTTDDATDISFITGLAQHPISALGPRCREWLRPMVIGRDVRWELRKAAMDVAGAAADAPLARALADCKWSADKQTDRQLALAGSVLMARGLSGAMRLAELVPRVLPGVLPLLAERAPLDEQGPLLGALSQAINEAIDLSEGDNSEPDGGDGARLEARAHLYRMQAPSVEGASRLWQSGPSTIDGWFDLLTAEARLSERGSLLEPLAIALAGAPPAAQSAAARRFVTEALLRRVARPQTSAANRPIPAPLIRASLSVTAAEDGSFDADGPRAVLDMLILSSANDAGLARIADSAVRARPAVMGPLVAWIDRAMSSGRVSRMACALGLAGFLLPHVPGVAIHLDKAETAAVPGFLSSVAGRARRTAARNAYAAQRASDRAQAPVRAPALAVASEILALAAEARVVVPATRVPDQTIDDSDALLALRLAELSREDGEQEEEDVIKGRRAPPFWLINANALTAAKSTRTRFR